MAGKKYPAAPAIVASRPLKIINSPMPAPGPVPTNLPKVEERIDSVRMAGSRTKSASEPAINGDMGLVNQAIRRRAEKTRPCKSGATFDCQIA